VKEFENCGVPISSNMCGSHFAEICLLVPRNLTSEMKEVFSKICISKEGVNNYDSSINFYSPLAETAKSKAFKNTRQVFNNFYNNPEDIIKDDSPKDKQQEGFFKKTFGFFMR